MARQLSEEIKERIAMIKRGEVPEGYKKTKDGIYPKDWQTKKMAHWIQLCERPVSFSK